MAVPVPVATTTEEGEEYHVNKKTKSRAIADVWLITLPDGRPISAVEVKRYNSDSDVLSDECALGQLYDYLMQIRTFYGQVEVFGFLTDFVNWRVCWLPESAALAASSVGLDPTAPLANRLLTTTAPLPTSAKGELQSAPLIHHTDPALALTIYSAISKNLLAQVAPVPLFHSQRSYMLYMRNSWKWANHSWKENLTVTLALPSAATQKFYALRYFPASRDGKVFLAATESCHVIIVKMYYEENTSLQEQEFNLWKFLWGVEVQKIKLCGRPALVLPFCFHVLSRPDGTRYFNFDMVYWSYSEGAIFSNIDSKISCFAGICERLQQFSSVSPEQAAYDAICAMADQGYQHDDLKWSHVAVRPLLDTKKTIIGLTPVLLDLCEVSIVTADRTADAKLNMLRALGL
eukprot:gene26661-32216_t